MLKYPNVTNVTLDQLLKVYNSRRESTEAKPVGLIVDLKANGQQTPLDVFPATEASSEQLRAVAGHLGLKVSKATDEEVVKAIEERTKLKLAELFLILRGHCRTNAFMLIRAEDPQGYEHITEGGKIKVRIWKGTTQDIRDQIHHDHAEVQSLDRQETFNSILKQTRDEISGRPELEHEGTDVAKAKLSEIQFKIMTRNWNLVKLHTNAAEDKISAYESRVLPLSLLPIPEGLTPQQVNAEREARRRQALLRQSEARELLLAMTRGYFQKVLRIIRLPFVETVYIFQLNQSKDEADITTFCNNRGIEVPDWTKGLIPDIAGPRGTGSDSVLKALEKAFNTDGKTVGSEYIRVWMEESTRFQNEQNNAEAGKPRAKSLGKPQVEELRNSLKSPGAKALINKVLQESVNDPLILETDQLLADIQLLKDHNDASACGDEKWKGFSFVAAIKARANEIRAEAAKK